MEKKEAIREFKRCYIASLECGDAEDSFWEKQLLSAEKALKEAGIRFIPGKGFVIQRHGHVRQEG